MFQSLANTCVQVKEFLEKAMSSPLGEALEHLASGAMLEVRCESENPDVGLVVQG